MLNLDLGSVASSGDRAWIATNEGATGHALYGPYETLEPGHYSVTFEIEPVEGWTFDRSMVCAMVDVVSDTGRNSIMFEFVNSDQILGRRPFVLEFAITHAREVEYRVHVNGSVPLRIADNPVVTRLGGAAAYVAPARQGFFDSHRQDMKRLYNLGARIETNNDSATMTLKGVSFHAKEADDINFVDELFVRNAYNVLDAKDTCVIDVGMNIGLASLLFAAKAEVREIHAFEPFENTHRRGLANIALNPALAEKVAVYNYGLGDKDEDVTLRVHTGSDSGGMSTIEVEGGVPTLLHMRDAGSTLRPIIESAKRRGLRVVAKIDCEGAEFPIFESLATANLFADIDVFMVEWHRVFAGKSQNDLILPLLKSGFVVFDLSPPTDNGFFYAVRGA